MNMQATHPVKNARALPRKSAQGASIRLIPLIDTHAAVTNSDAVEYEGDRPFITEYLEGFQTQFDGKGSMNTTFKADS
ncbi:hypothetical protein OD783_35550 [Pseudomonas aeruginosa]|nr:hypothetical protein [Pseudomonas aeruginosa]MCV4065597.1 hypothetical protein [Pseudomonas aeruginosa]